MTARSSGRYAVRCMAWFGLFSGSQLPSNQRRLSHRSDYEDDHGQITVIAIEEKIRERLKKDLSEI
jgi:hypothetical protein